MRMKAQEQLRELKSRLALDKASYHAARDTDTQERFKQLVRQTLQKIWTIERAYYGNEQTTEERL